MAFPILGNPYPEFTDVNGNPYASGTLEFRKPADNSNAYSYPTADDADAQTNPNGTDLTLNQRGTTSVGVWGEDGVTYKVTLKDSTGATVWTSTDIGWALTSSMVDDALSQVGVGDALYPRTAAETAAGIAAYAAGNSAGDIVQPWLAPGVVERYGVNTTPGTTDMTAAIQAALDQNEQTGGAPVRSGQTTYLISSGLTWCTGDEDRKTWYAENTYIKTTADITGLTIGAFSGTQESVEVMILGHLFMFHDGGQQTSTGAGIRFRQVYEGEFHFSAQGWKYGYHLTTYDSGNVYNKYYPIKIKDNYWGCYVEPTNTGWVNENTHYNGRFSMTFTSNIARGGHIYSAGNNNYFIRPSIEDSGTASDPAYYATAAFTDVGFWNSLQYPRLELASSNYTVNRIHLTSSSRGCTLMLGYDMKALYITDEGDRSKKFMNDGLHYHEYSSGTADAPILYFTRHSRNEDGWPLGVIRDLFTDADGTGLIIGNFGSSANDGFLLDLQKNGYVVEADDGYQYMCILDHTSGATAATANTGEPGTCTGWETYWERLPQRWQTPGGSALSGDLGGAGWAAVTAYTTAGNKGQATSRFRIANDGSIWTNQAETSVTSTVPTASGSVDKYITVYDEDGVALGELALFDVGRFST